MQPRIFVQRRVFVHSAFWLAFMALYVVRDMLFAGPSDLAYPFGLRLLRFFFSELSLLPWKAAPFYALFYFLIPRFFSRGAYLKTGMYFLGVLLICVVGYRSMVEPMNLLLYNEPTEYNVYSFRRILYTLTDLLPAVGLASAAKLLKGSVLFRKKEAALQQEKQAAELRFLKAQAHPHFLFNTLNNLYGLVRRNDPQSADYILKLSEVVRYILQECSSDRIPIEREIKVLQDYLALEELRYTERLGVAFEMEVHDLKQTIPPLILLPFVENAFKHGVSQTRENAFVDIKLAVTPARLHFRVSNSFDPEEQEQEAGIGLENVRRQLELIYGDRYTLNITPAGDVFSVDLNILLH